MWLFLRVLTVLLFVLSTAVRFVNGDPANPAAADRELAGAPAAPLLVDPAPLDVAFPLAGVADVPPLDAAALTVWEEPASAWMATALRLIVADNTAPPRAARDLMLLGAALHDGLRAAEQAEAAGHVIDAHALFAEIARRVLMYVHPLHADLVRQAADQATWVGVWRGDAPAAAVVPSRALGAAVAEAVLAWAAADGADRPVGEPQLRTEAPGRWAPTPPFFEPAQLPAWGAVRTVAVADPAQVQAPPPPAWDSPVMQGEQRAFAAAQQQLSAADRTLAAAWAAGAGTVTPPGMWMERAMGLVKRDALATPAATQVYAVLAVALHDAAVACWASKSAYQVARPIQWYSLEAPDWQPLLATPPHPSYPSGHASFSGAGGAVLAAFFPNDAAQLEAEAEAAAWSRVVGGIHWPMDGVAGLAQGRAVAAQALQHAGRTPVPNRP